MTTPCSVNAPACIEHVVAQRVIHLWAAAAPSGPPPLPAYSLAVAANVASLQFFFATLVLLVHHASHSEC